jgi:hypothetical protein
MATILRLLCAALSLAIGAVASIDPAVAESSELAPCPVLKSPDQRLVFEQWARGGECAKPVRTRVTDRFLGYSCIDRNGTTTCRTFTPGSDSRAFDTSKHYRCLDVAIVPTDEGVNVVGLREWAAPQPKQCDFDPNRNIVASELDFTSGQVCIAGLCVPLGRLSVIGQLRLRQLTEYAFRELGLLYREDQADIGTLVRPVLKRSQ